MAGEKGGGMFLYIAGAHQPAGRNMQQNRGDQRVAYRFENDVTPFIKSKTLSRNFAMNQIIISGQQTPHNACLSRIHAVQSSFINE